MLVYIGNVNSGFINHEPLFSSVCTVSIRLYIYVYLYPYLGSTPLSFTKRWFINVHFKEKTAINPHTFPMEFPHAFSRLESPMALRPRVVTLEGEVIAPNGNMSSLEALVIG